MSKYNKRQWTTLIVFSFCQFCNAVCFSLQAPFYPAEAEAKGATATQYGMVFGIYELVIFLICPFYGKYLNSFGAKLVNNLGIFIVAVMCILFGFLNHIEGANAFIGLSFVVRIIEAAGCGAFITSAFSIIAKEFPDNIGAAFASLETFFGFGLIIGPTLGGTLYQVGGYTLPFAVLGGILLFASLVVFCLLPSQTRENKNSSNPSGQLFAALKLPPVLLYACVIISTSFSIGFLQATLEPHLRHLELTPIQLGLMFVINGGAYALTAPIWGCVADKLCSPRLITIFGSTVVCIAFLLIGPAPFIPLSTTLPICIVALLLHGVGMGADLVATFTGLHQDAIENGFPNDLSTYGLVSGIWNSSFAFGCFIGPSLGGVLFDAIGFGWASMIVCGLHITMVIVSLFYMCCCSGRTYQIYVPIDCHYNKEEGVGFFSGKDSSYGSASSEERFMVP